MSIPTIAPIAVARRRDLLTPLSDQSAPIVKVPRTTFVPFLPVRYALGLDESDPPRVDGPFQVSDCDGKTMPTDGKVRYTLRRLRSGYLHIFSEKDQDWFSFLAQPEGGELQLLRIPAKYAKRKPEYGASGSVASVTSAENRNNACAQPLPLKTTATGLLLIPDDYPIWLAFSDAMWTERTFSDFRGQGLRDKHMRKFDPKEWKNTWKGVKHVAPIQEAPAHVADLKGQIQSGNFVNTLKHQAFWFSRDPFLRMNLNVLGCMQVSPKTIVDPKIMERGSIVALEDPSGIAMDLAALMIKRYEAFLEAPDPVHKDHPLRRRVQVASAIALIESAVRTQGEYDGLVSQKANKATGYQVAGEVEDHARLAGLGAETAKSYRSSIQAAHADSIMAMKVEESRKNAWNKYAECYDADAIKTWQENVKPHLEKFNANALIPLTGTYLAWMKSQRMRDYCQTHYDVYEAESGLVYTRMVERCIGGVQDKGACEAILQEWLKGNVTDKDNLVLRALVMNQDKLAQAVVEATKSGVSISWDTLLGVFSTELERVKDGHQDVLVRFLAQIMGSVVTVLEETGSKPLLAIKGAISGKPIVKVDLIGRQESFLRALLETSFQHAEPASGTIRISDLVQNEVDLLKVRGEPFDREFSMSCLVVADPDGVKGIPEGLKPSEVADWFQANIRTPEQFKALPVWKNAFRQTGSFVQAHSAPILKVVSGVVLFANMKDMSKKLRNSMAHKVEDTRWRFYASIGAFASAVLGTAAAALKYVPKLLKMGRGISALAVARGAELAGEITAGVAGLVVAAMDGVAAYVEYRRGHFGLFGLLLCSAVVGSASSIWLFAGFVTGIKAAAAATAGCAAASEALAATALSLTGWGILFALAGVIIGAIIASQTNNPVQDWLERCIFHGKPKPDAEAPDYYINTYIETDNLKKAMAG